VLPSIAVMSAWKGFGYSMLILLAGLHAVPAACVEAARIDGAGPWQRFRYVTLPLLRPVLFFVLVIETISAFQVFDAMYVMTQGGPARGSYSLVYDLYDTAFKFFDFGYASAIGIVLFGIVLVVSVAQRRLLDRGSTGDRSSTGSRGEGRRR
jgi:multiple sugar transport system permease protein